MALLRRVIALVAALAVPGAAAAQPIVSPQQVAEPGKAARPSSKAAKPSGKAAKPSGKAVKPSGKAVKPSGKAVKQGKAVKPAKSSKSTASRGGTSGARLATSTKRGPRADNMPIGFEWPPTRAMQASEGHIAAPIELTGDTVGGIRYASKWRRPPYTLDCQLARALVQVGPELYALGVREVRWGSIYRWSNVRTQGREFPFLSRHALGLAMDIVEFIDDTGRVANVEQHYTQGDPLLLAIEQTVNASGKFRIVLTPRNDPRSHHDHFHIEANPSYAKVAGPSSAAEPVTARSPPPKI
jgi:hypothetical protein